MIEPKKGKYQIPVLKYSTNGGGYRDGLLLNTIHSKGEVTDGVHCPFRVSFDFEECSLRRLIEQGKASIKVNVSQYCYRDSFDVSLEGETTINLDIRELSPGVLIDFLPIIIANEDFDMDFNPAEMLPKYEWLNPPFHVKRGTILGYGESFSYDVGGVPSVSSFFQISEITEPGKQIEPFIVELGASYITVKMLPDEYRYWNQCYSKGPLVKDYTLLNAAIGYPAMHQVMLALFFDDFAKYRNFAWYSAVVSTLRNRLKIDPEEEFKKTREPKEKMEQAWKFACAIFPGLLKDSFSLLLSKGRAGK